VKVAPTLCGDHAVCHISPRHSQYAALRCGTTIVAQGATIAANGTDIAANGANIVAQGQTRRSAPTHVGMTTDHRGDRIGGVRGVAGNAPTTAMRCCKIRYRGDRQRRCRAVQGQTCVSALFCHDVCSNSQHHRTGATFTVAPVQRGGAYCATVGAFFYIPQYGTNSNHSRRTF